MHSYKRIYIFEERLKRIRNKNPLYYWRSIGGISHSCSEMRCSKSTTKVSNNSETTKFFVINLLDTGTILLRTTLSIS